MFYRNSLKLRIAVQPVMQKARMVEQKINITLLIASGVGESVWWAWTQLFVGKLYLKFCKFLSQLCGWLPPVHLSISASRSTFGLEVYTFHLNLLHFSVFLPSFLL